MCGGSKKRKKTTWKFWGIKEKDRKGKSPNSFNEVQLRGNAWGKEWPSSSSEMTTEEGDRGLILF